MITIEEYLLKLQAYSDDELLEIQSSIDNETYFERFDAISNEIERRYRLKSDRKKRSLREIVALSGMENECISDSVEKLKSYLLIAGIAFTLANVVYMKQYNFIPAILLVSACLFVLQYYTNNEVTLNSNHISINAMFRSYDIKYENVISFNSAIFGLGYITYNTDLKKLKKRVIFSIRRKSSFTYKNDPRIEELIKKVG